MVRPTKDDPRSAVASAKWRETMEKKHGGKEGLHEFMQSIGRRGGSVSTPTGGFASMTPERRRELGRIGGAKSTRAGVRTGEGKTKRRIKK